MRVAPEIVLTEAEHAELAKLVRSKLTSVRLAQRARIVLLAAEGMQNKAIAQQLGVGRVQVARWRERYAEARLAGIERDLPRGAPPTKVDVARLVELTTQTKPKAATHWSTRTMAAELGVSAASAARPRSISLWPNTARSESSSHCSAIPTTNAGMPSRPTAQVSAWRRASPPTGFSVD